MAITTEASLITSATRSIPYYVSISSGTFGGIIPIMMTYGSSPSIGYPSQTTFATPGIAGTTVNGNSTTIGGTFPFTNPVVNSSYLSAWNISPIVTTTNLSLNFEIFDLLFYNSGIVAATTTAQTVNSVTLPARDANGAALGVGVVAWLILNAVSSAAITNTTISYTNPAGVAGRIGTIIGGFVSSNDIGSMLPFSLQANDTGVKSIQSITLGTAYAASPTLVMLRDIASLGIIAGTTGNVSAHRMDWSQLGFPILYGNTALMLRTTITGAGTYSAMGEITYSYG